ncbi:hypothetical protein [Trichlorobacter lovleyi]|uniref:Uncharacterized protein n=1 Tax=Trichlorobacter lovleyi (strain ATCC BAA-1151 / DSM 17278 / SZ) TaxID=398767 RepID=B3E301_TRIL1|nr:hypothetical protein [Trichlorobacter lovleyi]ACD97261.1 hypothetical protein Glov_3560 [Trichlorobacter lovleyi SZ]
MISSVGTFLHAVPENKVNSSSASSNKSSFDAILSSIKTNTQTSSTAETDRADLTIPVDQNDEAAATKELLALMKMLMFGKIDYSALKNSDTNNQMADGPVRAELERLKTVIRKIIHPGDESGSSDQDKISLKALFDSLPDETKALLKRAFPDLDRLLKNEEQRIANEKAKNADQLLNSGMSAMTNEFMLAAVPVNNFL